MENITYGRLLNKSIELYKQGKYKEAYDYITLNKNVEAGNYAQIYNFRYSFACVMGEYELALDLLKEAVVDKGYWYSYEYLLSDDDLKPIRNKDSFKEILDLCKTRENEAHSTSKPELKIIKPKNLKGKSPLVLALHGDQENVDISSNYWDSTVYKDSVIALPQSSQIEFSTGYVWEDVDKGVEELKSHFETLCSDYDIDENDITLCAFSAGANVALKAILDGSIPARRFVFIAPWFPDLDGFEGGIKLLNENNIKGYLVCGDKDDDCFEVTEEFSAMLDKEKVNYEYAVIEGLDHDYPPHFDDLLKFVNKFFIEN